MTEQKIIEVCAGTILAVVLPADVYLLLAFLMILVDSVFGIITIKKRGDKFYFKKLIFNGILVKTTVYSLIILTIYWTDTILIDSIIGKSHIVTKIGTLFILMNEIGSIIKHFKIITNSNLSKNKTMLNSAIVFFREIIKKIWK